MKLIIDWLCVLTFIFVSGCSVTDSAPDSTEKLDNHLSELELFTKHRELSEGVRKTGRMWLGGTPADWSQFPYLVFITIEGKSYWYGGGAIIGEQHVLTSQNFISIQEAKDLRVTIADVQKKVVSISNTPGYSAAGLSILKLDSKFDLSGPNITSIPLQDKDIPLGANCVLSGVDSLEAPEPNDNYVHYINVPIIENVVCNILWAQELTDEAVCSGAHNATDERCYTNVGDPLVCDGALTGISSILHAANDPKRPGIYGKIAHYKKWIEDQMIGSNSHRVNHNILAVILIAPVSFWISKFHV